MSGPAFPASSIACVSAAKRTDSAASKAAARSIAASVARAFVGTSAACSAYASDKCGHGEDHARAFLREHPDTAAAIEAKVRETVVIPAPTRIKGNGNGNGADV